MAETDRIKLLGIDSQQHCYYFLENFLKFSKNFENLRQKILKTSRQLTLSKWQAFQ